MGKEGKVLSFRRIVTDGDMPLPTNIRNERRLQMKANREYKTFSYPCPQYAALSDHHSK